jgi:ketosteroid isomerase-like protein
LVPLPTATFTLATWQTRAHHHYDDEIEHPNFEGHPQLTVERTLSTDDVVVTTGTGLGHLRGGQQFRFAFSDLFTFRGDAIVQVDSYVVPL